MSYNVGYYLNGLLGVGVFGFVRDYGYCQPKSKAKIEVAEKGRCTGCIARMGLGSFISDHVVFLMKGESDMYMQNTLTVGIDLF